MASRNGPPPQARTTTTTSAGAKEQYQRIRWKLLRCALEWSHESALAPGGTARRVRRNQRRPWARRPTEPCADTGVRAGDAGVGDGPGHVGQAFADPARAR